MVDRKAAVNLADDINEIVTVGVQLNSLPRPPRRLPLPKDYLPVECWHGRCCVTSRRLYVAKTANTPHWVLIRNASSEASTQRPRALHRARKYAKYTSYFLLSSVFGLVTIGAGIFVTTRLRTPRNTLSGCRVHPSLCTRNAVGPITFLLSVYRSTIEDDEEHKKLAEKPKLVICWRRMGG